METPAEQLPEPSPPEQADSDLSCTYCGADIDPQSREITTSRVGGLFCNHRCLNDYRSEI